MCPSNNVWQVVGVTSWSENCAGARRPGIFTRVNQFYDWIEETVSK